ncbi:glycosyltransferase family 90 protein [Schizophyllum commune]
MPHGKTSSFEWRIRVASPTEVKGDEEQGFRLSRTRRFASLAARALAALFLATVAIVFFRAGLDTPTGRTTSDALEQWLNAHVDAPTITEASTSTFSDNHQPDTHQPVRHPIQRLIADAQARFAQKLARQSQTLPEAVAEYERRYGRRPPKGFNHWWAYARDRDFIMMDEFDAIDEDLAPFWNISGAELRSRASLAGLLPSASLVSIRDGRVVHEPKPEGTYQKNEPNDRARGFGAILNNFARQLPNMTFAVNAMAEGMVLVPWEQRYDNASLSAESLASSGFNADMHPGWAGGGNVWEAWRRTCKPTDPARQPSSDTREARAPVDARVTELAFTPTSPSDIDFCAYPEAHLTQGLFFSDWRTIPALLPVLTPARSPGASDIRIPSHYYYGGSEYYTYAWDPERRVQNETDAMEVSWADKSSRFFWRGSTTGGGSSPRGYAAGYQRHRFVRLAGNASDAPKEVTFADDQGEWRTVEVPTGELNNELMDAAFTTLTTGVAYPGGADALRKDHRFADRVPLGAHWAHKYLVDLDGQGYSARFFAFLESGSVPVKATVYNEFFHDWIEPWVHFIPLSTIYEEIYNIHAFFSGPPRAANVSGGEDHDNMLYDIAQAGREWKHRMGRKVDMEVYVFRLCLEYARLWADDRESMDFIL